MQWVDVVVDSGMVDGRRGEEAIMQPCSHAAMQPYSHTAI